MESARLPTQSPFPGQWHRVELRHLLTLEAVAEERSIVRAARRLGYVQSAVSQQLAILEGFLGVRLVDRSRGGRHSELTAEGVAFLEHARAVLGEMRAAAAELNSGADGHVVRLATEQTVAAGTVFAVLGGAGPSPALLPNLETIEGLDRERILTMIENGEVDAGCLSGAVPVGFDHVTLYCDRWTAVSAAGGENTPVTLAQLSDEHVVSLRGVSEAFPCADELPDSIATAERPSTLAAMIRAGLGIGVVPNSVLRGYGTELTFRDITLTKVDLSRTVYLVWRSRGPVRPALRALIDVLGSTDTLRSRACA